MLEGIDFTQVIAKGVELKSCSKSKQSYKKHLHHELSVGMIREGSTTVDFGELTFTFSRGEGVIIPPMMSHMCSPEDLEHWRFDMLYIDPEIYADRLSFDKVAKLTGDDVDELEDFLGMLDQEVEANALEERLIELLVMLEEKTQPMSASEDCDDTAEKIRFYLETHYTKKLTLEDLQHLFGLNKFAIIRSFGKKFNTTPIAYQLQLKVAEAKACLSEGRDVFEICETIGFYDQAHFIREFRKMNGLTPNAYVEKLKNTSSAADQN